jgi:hypothetical protein
VDHDRYRELKIGEKVLYHGDDQALYEGVVVKRDELKGGRVVVIGVLAPRGPEPTDQQVVWPSERDLHAIPFDGGEHCNRCAWHVLAYLASDRKGPFTGTLEKPV